MYWRCSRSSLHDLRDGSSPSTAAARLRTLAIALLVTLSGCGNGNGNDGVPNARVETEETTTFSTAAAPTTHAVSSSGSSDASLLKRRDAPPQGIKAQFEFFQEGDGACRGLDTTRPAAVVELPQPTIGMVFIICFPGFTPNRPVQAEVQLPDGSSRQMQVREYDFNEGIAQWFWYSLPGDPIGTHTVRATQGSVRGAGSFTITRATTPRVLVAPPNEGPAGTTFRVGMAGFTPNSETLFYLYRGIRGDRYEYLSSVVVRINATGEAIYPVTTRRDDPIGTYCFVFRGPKAAPDYACGGFASFTVT